MACFIARIGLRIVGDVLGEKLQRNSSAELSILRLVDDTLSALAELLDDLVLQYGPTDHDSRIVALMN